MPVSPASIPPERRFDVLVAGGSFAGLAAATQVARARRRVLVVDAGRPRNRFAAASHGFLTRDGSAPAEIRRLALEQLLRYPTARFEHGRIERIERVDGHFHAHLAGGPPVCAQRLVLATGVEDVLPDIPGLADLWGRQVLHCPYCHGFEVGGGALGALWTGEPSLHQAKIVTDWGQAVTLFAPGTAITPDEERQLAEHGVAVERRAIARVAAAETGCAVVLDDGTRVALAALFMVPQVRQASALAQALGCEMEAGPFGPVIRTDAMKQTSVPGVYAAGDAARPVHNATWAAADGVTAGIFAHQSLITGGNPCAAAAGD